MNAVRGLVLGAAVLAAFGCSSLLGLDEFEDQRPDASGGAGGTGGSSGSSGSAGSSGSSGAAGTAGAPVYVCGLDVEPLTIFDALHGDIFQAGGEIDADSLLVVRDPDDPVAHVVITGTRGGSPAVAVRTVLDEDLTLGTHRVFFVPSAQAPATPTPAKLIDGFASNTLVTLYGWLNSTGGTQPTNAWVRVALDADSNGVLGGEQTFQLPAAQPCGDVSAEIVSAAFSHESGGVSRVAATCDLGTQRVLMAGPVDALPEVTTQGDAGDKELEVEDYVFSDGTHLVQAGGAEYRFGSDDFGFDVPHTLDLGGTSGSTNGIALVPRGDAEHGAVVVAARILTVIQDSEIQTAQLTPPEYSELDIVEPAPFFNVMGVDGRYLAPRMRFGIDPERLAAASVGQTDSSVRLHYLLRDGAPAVLGHPVYVPGSASTVKQAAAMPMDDSNVLVVWVEQGASKLEVRGAIANCAEQR